MARRPQNLPRSLRAGQGRDATPGLTTWLGALTQPRIAIAIAAILAAIAAAVILALSFANGDAAEQSRIDRDVATLLRGIPQHGPNLGYPSAPVTLEVFADLKDPDSRNWFDNYLPAILAQDVRTGRLQLHFHSYKTNTYSPTEFVEEHTAALSAGAQNKLWNYVEIFYHQQRNALKQSEREAYATNSFLEGIAHQVPGLSLPQWLADRHTERRQELPSEESTTATSYKLHVTPSFRIGRTDGHLTNYAGNTILKYNAQHPISFITASDVNKTIRHLDMAPRRTRLHSQAG